MQQANIDYLNSYEHIWTTLRDAKYVSGLTNDIKENFKRIMAEEFQPGYAPDLWCPHCIAEMIRGLYQRYETYKSTPVVEHVSASFPVNDKPRRRGNQKSE